MKGAARKWLRRLLIVTALTTALLVLPLVVLLGSEWGTHWVLSRVAAIAPMEIRVTDTSGTLLTTVDIPFMRYKDADRELIVDDAALNIDWTATTFATLAIERLTARQVTMMMSPGGQKETQPLEVAMPELPLGIAIEHFGVNAVHLGDTLITEISLNDVRAERRIIDLGDASALIGEVIAAVRDVSVELDGSVPVRGELSWKHAAGNWSGSGSVAGSLANLEVRHELAGEYSLATRGSVQLLHRTEPTFDLINEFAALNHAAWSASDGHVQVTGTSDDYRLSFALSIAHEDLASANIRGGAAGNLQGLAELELAADMGVSALRVLGNIAWAPALSLDLVVTGNGIDPSRFAAVPAGSLDSELALQASSAEDFMVDIVSLDGRWNGQTTTASGQLARRGDQWRCASCRVSVADNLVYVNGGLSGQSIDGEIDVEAPLLEQLWPGVSGSLHGSGELRGSLTLPILSGQATGTQLVFDDWSLGHLSVASGGTTAQELDVVLAFTELAHADTLLGTGSADISGELEDLRLAADWRLDAYTASATVRVALGDETLTGSIDAASLSEPLGGTWELDSSTSFVLGPDSQRLAAASWSNGEAEMRHGEIVLQEGSLSAAAALGNVPLGLLDAVLPDNVRIAGQVDATADLQHGVDGWNGNLDWQQRDTVLRFIASDGDEYSGAVPQARATVQLRNSAVTLNAAVSSEQGTEAVLDASLTGMNSDAGLRARLQLNGDQWEWVPRLFPEVEDFTGSLRSDILATGSVLSPDLQGELNWTDGALAVPGLNLPLTGIDITLTGSSAGDMTVSGEARSGDGVLRVSGRLEDVTSTLPSFNIRLLGDRATLLNWNDFLLVASPDVEVSGDRAGVHVTGRVEMDQANIGIRKLPEGAVSPSADVAVVGREVEAPERTRLSGEVEIILSEDIHINALGLDTNLEGQLRFIVREGREPQGVGELRLVGGVFEAYGQQLEIETGTMVFTGPLDNPLINVRAVRRIERIAGTIVAGIDLSGRARELRSSLFSDPAMSQADTLSYLVLGRPLEDATAADGSNLSNSAYSLGLRQAAQITNQIGQTVGLDELRVDGSNQNTTELIAGKQINSRLYARYAYGVFSRLGKLLIRYKLSDSLSIEIGAGENQSMDVLYTVERE